MLDELFQGQIDVKLCTKFLAVWFSIFILCKYFYLFFPKSKMQKQLLVLEFSFLKIWRIWRRLTISSSIKLFISGGCILFQSLRSNAFKISFTTNIIISILQSKFYCSLKGCRGRFKSHFSFRSL